MTVLWVCPSANPSPTPSSCENSTQLKDHVDLVNAHYKGVLPRVKGHAHYKGVLPRVKGHPCKIGRACSGVITSILLYMWLQAQALNEIARFI